MILSNRNASSDSIESLRESLASMEQQLASLYAEQEFKKGLTFSGDETLAALYEDKQRLSARTIADLRESVESLSAQLADVYAQREAAPDVNQSALLATIDGLTLQLHDLYEERELAQAGLGHAGGRADAPQHLAGARAAQPSAAKEEARCRELADMAQSFSEQVAVLLEERNDLVRTVDSLKADLSTAKRRARDMIDALVAQSLN